MKGQLKDVIMRFRSIELNMWDKIFLIVFNVIIIGMFYIGMTALTLG